MRTVQGDLEAALSKLFDADAVTVAAGRTDAGVHALGQVVSATGAPDRLDLDQARDAINVMCGPSIAVHFCRQAADDFSARFSARSRTYVYAICEGPILNPFLASTALYHRELLDLDVMNEAAGHLIGAHEFSSFGRIREPGATAQRNLFELSAERDGAVVRIRARANAFIQQMVRSVVGTLIQVGEGGRSPDDLPAILAAKDRAAAGPVAPPHGLCLVAVEYDEGWGVPLQP
ncbi:MAG: tRNA pseudouridine38-40 synthase [Actinomycetota bacterium]|nr:tRNA pseudouridine38-40 synthase [Actinomycetota bacterium]